jgi:RNAse (barnase) inhibitor barstar
MSSLKMLAKQLGDASQNGVYLLTHDPTEVEQAAKDAGLHFFRIDVGDAKGKKDFLARIAQELHFPYHFGHNWDALNDSLSDLDLLSDKRGLVLILENAGRYGAKHQDDLESAISVLDSAAEFWKEEDQPFWGFIHGAADSNYELPKWPQ